MLKYLQTANSNSGNSTEYQILVLDIPNADLCNLTYCTIEKCWHNVNKYKLPEPLLFPLCPYSFSLKLK